MFSLFKDLDLHKVQIQMSNFKQKKYHSKQEAIEKLKHYCAYQDRCQSEVKYKLIDLGIRGDDIDDVLLELLQGDYVNEERFARSFARGKFLMKAWGKNKITVKLKEKQVSKYCIEKGLTEIEDEAYMQTLKKVVAKKWESLRQQKYSQTKKQKVAAFAIQRGFESHLVWAELKEYQVK